MTSNIRSSCCYLPSAEITAGCQHTHWTQGFTSWEAHCQLNYTPSHYLLSWFSHSLFTDTLYPLYRDFKGCPSLSLVVLNVNLDKDFQRRAQRSQCAFPGYITESGQGGEEPGTPDQISERGWSKPLLLSTLFYSTVHRRDTEDQRHEVTVAKLHSFTGSRGKISTRGCLIYNAALCWQILRKQFWKPSMCMLVPALAAQIKLGKVKIHPYYLTFILCYSLIHSFSFLDTGSHYVDYVGLKCLIYMALFPLLNITMRQ